MALGRPIAASLRHLGLLDLLILGNQQIEHGQRPSAVGIRKSVPTDGELGRRTHLHDGIRLFRILLDKHEEFLEEHRVVERLPEKREQRAPGVDRLNKPDNSFPRSVPPAIAPKRQGCRIKPGAVEHALYRGGECMRQHWRIALRRRGNARRHHETKPPGGLIALAWRETWRKHKARDIRLIIVRAFRAFVQAAERIHHAHERA